MSSDHCYNKINTKSHSLFCLAPFLSLCRSLSLPPLSLSLPPLYSLSLSPSLHWTAFLFDARTQSFTHLPCLVHGVRVTKWPWKYCNLALPCQVQGRVQSSKFRVASWACQSKGNMNREICAMSLSRFSKGYGKGSVISFGLWLKVFFWCFHGD